MLGASPGEATVGGKRYGAKPTVKTYVRIPIVIVILIVIVVPRLIFI